MTGQVIRDETGLHALECECMECEAGFRPSPMQRHHAAEQLRRKEAWEALKKKPSREQLRREERRLAAKEAARKRSEGEREWRRRNPPLSAEEVEELNKFKAARFPSLAGGSKK